MKTKDYDSEESDIFNLPVKEASLWSLVQQEMYSLFQVSSGLAENRQVQLVHQSVGY